MKKLLLLVIGITQITAISAQIFIPKYISFADPKDKTTYSIDKNLNFQDVSFYDEEYPFNLEYYYERKSVIQSMEITPDKIFIIRYKESFTTIDKIYHNKQTKYNDRTDWFFLENFEFLDSIIPCRTELNSLFFNIKCNVFEYPINKYGSEKRIVSKNEILLTKEKETNYLKIYIEKNSYNFNLCFSPCKHRYKPNVPNDQHFVSEKMTKPYTVENLEKLGFKFKNIKYFSSYVVDKDTVYFLKKEITNPIETPKIINGYLMNNINIIVINNNVISAEQENSMDCKISHGIGMQWFNSKEIYNLFK
jgi:hypothetical protein